MPFQKSGLFFVEAGIDKARVKIDLNNSAIFSNGPYLIILQIAAVVYQGVHRAMRCYDRLCGYLDYVPKSLIAYMAHIYHHAKSVHFLDNLSTKFRKSFFPFGV